MEFDELVTKLINHMDESLAKTESKIRQEINQTKGEIIREVSVLLEQQRDTLIKFTDTRASVIEDHLTTVSNSLHLTMC